MGRPILTSFMRSRTTKPPLQIKMSPTQLSRQEKLDLFIFFAGSVRRDKREMLSISQKQIPHAPTVRLPRNRKEGPGARASWVGV
jgi:hypothetical protein